MVDLFANLQKVRETTPSLHFSDIIPNITPRQRSVGRKGEPRNVYSPENWLNGFYHKKTSNEIQSLNGRYETNFIHNPDKVADVMNNKNLVNVGAQYLNEDSTPLLEDNVNRDTDLKADILKTLVKLRDAFDDTFPDAESEAIFK